MARRAGKAASRKARQRKAQRGSAPSPITRAIDAMPARPVEEAPSPRPSGPTTPPAPSRRSRPASLLPGGSTLTATERSEYHYVERDLRNIGILTAVMIGLLIVAWLIFTATGQVA
jgi:hypothetical protein